MRTIRPLWHALLILIISFSVLGRNIEEVTVGEPSDLYSESSEDENANRGKAFFADSSVNEAAMHDLHPEDPAFMEPGTESQISEPGVIPEVQLATVEEEAKFNEVTQLLDAVESELAMAIPEGEESVGRDARYSERSKIMDMLKDVRNELDLAQTARKQDLQREYETGMFGGSSRTGRGGFTYSSRRRWETGHGYTFRNEWRRPSNHRWTYGHGYEDPKSVLYDMEKNSFRNGNKGGGGMFGGGSRGQTWHYGHGYEPKGTWNIGQTRRSGGLFGSRSSSSSSRGGGFFGRRLLEFGQ